jgi:hypothetical protein
MFGVQPCLATHPDMARSGGCEAGKDPEDGGFAGPGGAVYGQNFSQRHFEGYIEKLRAVGGMEHFRCPETQIGGKRIHTIALD